MQHRFAQTSNVNRFLAGIRELRARGAAEASWALLTSEPGLGKTDTLTWWAGKEGALYLRAKSAWTPRWAMAELIQQMGLEPESTQEKMFAQALGALARSPRPIVVDEVENCLHDHKVLERFRDLSDLTECPVIIAGMDRVRTRLMRYEQISSRITAVIEFAPSDLADVQVMAETLLEIQLDEAALELVLQQSEGRYRLIMDALSSIERFAKVNSLTRVEGARLSAEKIALCHDWRVTKRCRPAAKGVK